MSGRGGGRGRGKKFGHKGKNCHCYLLSGLISIEDVHLALVCFNHSGQAKHFTNEDDIRRQNEEFRKQKEAEADNEEESSGEEKEENANAGKKVTVNTAANKQKVRWQWHQYSTVFNWHFLLYKYQHLFRQCG